ncbi:hypothetical protein C100_04390 [Sphingobium sp. C100]|uniref:DUF736 domain-containing protein n=1 Tax=Sphingobium sp. C100 TaxID=1207055 RepID=UPI0003D5A0BF|nr:DUF736 domain-containing protein [Sphingobium sp. C100]ETI64979.1 hypothetical protein C100_04390 [Sphingobium sp. C100]
MAIIGTFTAQDSRLTGKLETLTLSQPAQIRAVEKDNDKAPDFRIYAGKSEFEVGAAWKKTSREGRDYLSVKLDDPSFPAPIYGSLVETDEAGKHQLIWSR